MTIAPADIQKLRQQTGVGVLEAKRALEATGGNLTRAATELRKAGKKIARQKSERTTTEGTIGVYVHNNGRVAAMVVLACETDFVARTDDFRQLAHELAMQVAATDPQYLKPADIPSAVVAHEEEIIHQQLRQAGKPATMWSRIVPGKLEKFYAEVCLLEQPYIRDDTQSIADLLNAATAKLGENIQVRRFSRLSL
ncbi:MAG: elongation factor Ts [Candidatus Kerfeldbacteria bacterium]|nr:elongation factor Ts [Candidatus Kerfeldbacteria bacterium]